MREISLTQGKVALVDDSDYDWLNQWNWIVSKDRNTFYAKRTTHTAKIHKRTGGMHRVILGLQLFDKRQCDHRDGNGLNNQRANLRICTPTQNQQAARKRTIGYSRYKGVSWHYVDLKWFSQIKVNKRKIYLGAFNSEFDAARAYNQAALKYFDKFAVLNKVFNIPESF